MLRKADIPSNVRIAERVEGLSAGATDALAAARASTIVKAAAASSRTAEAQIAGARSLASIIWPASKVPRTNASDAPPRIRPYSNGRVLPLGGSALTARASAREV